MSAPARHAGRTAPVYAVLGWDARRTQPAADPRLKAQRGMVRCVTG